MATPLKSDIWLLLHRWTGILTAFFLLLAALTGCALAMRETIDHWVNSDLAHYSGAADDRLAPIELVEIYSTANPDVQVVEFPLNPKDNENLPVMVTAKPGLPALDYDEVFLAASTGEVVGTRPTDAGFSGRQIIPLLAEFHMNFLLGDFGRIFLGIVAIGWLISSLVGFYLTFPKKGPFFKNWWPVWTYSPKRSFARQMLDIHRASALWLFPLVLAVAATSVTLNFYFEFWSPLATTIAPLEKSLFDLDAPFPDGTTPALTFADGLALARAEAEQANVSWQPATMLYLPEWNLFGVTLSDNGVLNYKYMGPIYYYFDAIDGSYAHEVNPYTDSFGLKMIRTIYPLHSGEIGGPLFVFLIFLSGIATAEMCITGIWVWLKKRGPRMAASKRAREQTSA